MAGEAGVAEVAGVAQEGSGHLTSVEKLNIHTNTADMAPAFRLPPYQRDMHMHTFPRVHACTHGHVRACMNAPTGMHEHAILAPGQPVTM